MTRQTRQEASGRAEYPTTPDLGLAAKSEPFPGPSGPSPEETQPAASDASRCRAIVSGDGGDWYLCGHNQPCVWHGTSATQED